MGSRHTGNAQPSIDIEEHEHSDGLGPATKRVLAYGWDGTSKNILFSDGNGIIRSIVTIAHPISTASVQGRVTIQDILTADGNSVLDEITDEVNVKDNNARLFLQSIEADTNALATFNFASETTLSTVLDGIGAINDVAANTTGSLSAKLRYLTETGISGMTVLPPGGNFIGLATIIPTYLSSYTSLATIISASGDATIFIPPSGQRFIIKDIIIGSLGRNEVSVKSGANTLIPLISLATTGLYAHSFGDSGLRGKAINDAFVMSLSGTATVSFMTNVRFE